MNPDPETSHDPRIHVDLAQLRRLGLQARGLSLLPRQPAGSILNGRHASRLRGRGLNFEELRQYLDGDDVRTIDWKVTARSGTPHVRVYTEERDRPALLLVDQRMSMFFGSETYMKSVVAAEAAALAAHLVLAQGDRVGGLVFGDTGLAEHRPVRSPVALDRLLASIAQANQRLHAGVTDAPTVTLNKVLRAALRISATSGLILVFSDFVGLDAGTEKLLSALSRRNDVILFNIADPLAEGLPVGMKLAISDGAVQAELDTADGPTRSRVEDHLRGRLADLFHWSRKYGFPVLPLTTAEPALGQIRHLLGPRRTVR